VVALEKVISSSAGGGTCVFPEPKLDVSRAETFPEWKFLSDCFLQAFFAPASGKFGRSGNFHG